MNSTALPFSFNLLEQLMLGGMIFFLMFTIGTGLEIKDFKESLKNKKSVTTALVCQYGFMPLLALIFYKLFNTPVAAYLVLLIVTSSPGGTSSNIFCYLSKSNVGLSVSLTIISSFVSVIMTPFLINFYALRNSDIDLKIPYLNIMLTLVASMIPIFLGMLLRSRNKPLAHKADFFAQKIGLLLLTVMVLIWIPKLYNFINIEHVKLVSLIFLVCLSGMILSLIASLLIKTPMRDAQTISFETGIQNAPLSFAIITLSFPKEHVIHEYSWVALVYGALSVGCGLMLTMAFRYINQKSDKRVINY